jgi:hypothetical protein
MTKLALQQATHLISDPQINRKVIESNWIFSSLPHLPTLLVNSFPVFLINLFGKKKMKYLLTHYPSHFGLWPQSKQEGINNVQMQLNKNDAAIKNRSLMQKYYAWASKQKSPLTARSINHVLQSKKKC